MFGRVALGVAFIAAVSTQALADVPDLSNLTEYFTDLVFSDTVRELGVVTAVPGPIAGAGIPGLIAGAAATLAWYRRRKQ